MGRNRGQIYKKRKFHGNRFTVNKSDINNSVNSVDSDVSNSASGSNLKTPRVGKQEVISASKRKLFSDDEDVHNSSQEQETGNNIIIDVNILSEFVNKNTNCKYCNNSDCVYIMEDVSVRKGLSSKLVLKCDFCKHESSARSSKLASNKVYEVNLKMVYGMRCIGRGQSGAKTLCGILDLPPQPAKFSNYNNIMEESVRNACEASMKKAAHEAVVENGGSTDVTVAVDGSWQKRGHSSLHGVVSATLFDTGKVVDVDVLSKYCQGCQVNQEGHICVKNFDGASGGMEAVGAVNMFGRSESERGLRYVKYLGDGDSKGFMKVNESKPYGDLLTEKLECVGHVMKRLGCRLRKWKKDMKGKKLSDGKCVGGTGRLTDAEIDKLQQYYGLAIRRNVNDVKAMQRAVWATYFHKCSTDDKPIHQLCPKGSDSWCKYQKAAATGATYKHTHSLPSSIMEAIKPIYRDLSQPNLLKKCVHGKTQNVNESLNNCLWERIPKNIFVGAQTLRIGVFDAVLTFNDGVVAREKVLSNMGVVTGSNCKKALRAIDNIRIIYDNRAAEAMSKESRTESRLQMKRKEADEDGQDDYCAGKY